MLGFKLDRQGKTVAQAQVKAADCPIVKMDASGAVNFDDFFIFADNFGKTGTYVGG